MLKLRPKFFGLLGVTALALAAGCEDPPVLPTIVPSTAVASRASASPSPSPSGSPSFLPTGVGASVLATPTPIGATPTPTIIFISSADPSTAVSPSPSPSVTPSASASTSSAVASVSLDAPVASADFSASTVPVLITSSAEPGVFVKDMTLVYDGLPLATVTPDTNGQARIANWNPNMVNSLGSPNDTTPVPFGTHTLSARGTTASGTSLASSVLTFTKALRIGSWLQALKTGNTAVILPSLPNDLTDVHFYATNRFLFSFFGEFAQGIPHTDVNSLSLFGDPFPSWNKYDAPNLPWRQHPALTGADTTVYLAGGCATKGGLPTASAYAFDVFAHQTTQLADMPVAVSDAGAAIVDHQLYVVGGTTDDVASGAADVVMRLPLNGDDTPRSGAAWERRAALPTPMRGVAVAVGNGQLFAFGGQVHNGTRREAIWAYNASADTWTRAQVLPSAVSDGQAVELGGAIYYLGGYGASGQTTTSTYRFDYTNFGAAVKAYGGSSPDLPDPRGRFGATVLRDDPRAPHLLIGGGETNTTSPIDGVYSLDTL